jgi:hypothetical protein
MRVGEPPALKRQPVYVRRPDLCRAITADITVAEIIREYEDDVGLGCVGRMQRGQRREQQGGEKGKEGGHWLKDNAQSDLLATGDPEVLDGEAKIDRVVHRDPRHGRALSDFNVREGCVDRRFRQVEAKLGDGSCVRGVSSKPASLLSPLAVRGVPLIITGMK